MPKLMKNVVYISAAIVFNDEGKVLVVQEECLNFYGRWYVPHGRVDPNESIQVSGGMAIAQIIIIH